MEPVIIVHGGAYNIPDGRVETNITGLYLKYKLFATEIPVNIISCALELSTYGVKNYITFWAGTCVAAKKGYERLLAGDSCVDAAAAAISVLEDDPTFDAG